MGEPGTADTGRAGTGYRTDIIHRAWQRGESQSRAEPLLSCKPPGGRLCSVYPVAADGLAYICGLCYAIAAQLAERLLWEQEAVGSRPTDGTKTGFGGFHGGHRETAKPAQSPSKRLC